MEKLFIPVWLAEKIGIENEREGIPIPEVVTSTWALAFSKKNALAIMENPLTTFADERLQNPDKLLSQGWRKEKEKHVFQYDESGNHPIIERVASHYYYSLPDKINLQHLWISPDGYIEIWSLNVERPMLWDQALGKPNGEVIVNGKIFFQKDKLFLSALTTRTSSF